MPFIYKHEAGDRKASLGDALGTNVCSEGSVPGKTQVEVEGLQIVWLGKSLYIQISVSVQFSSVQFSSVTQSCLTVCDPMNCSMPGLPVHHKLPEFIQTHAHRVGDDIQPSHPLSSPSPPAPNPSQQQGLFQ